MNTFARPRNFNHAFQGGYPGSWTLAQLALTFACVRDMTAAPDPYEANRRCRDWADHMVLFAIPKHPTVSVKT